jgi:hypothetical protein
MTPLMEKALEELRKLPEDEQEALAALILSEIDSERRWDKLFAQSEDLLSQLAEEALKEHRLKKL